MNICKAKRLDNGEWIEGTLFPTGNWLAVFDKNLTYIGNENLLRAVDPNTVCRDTGLRDKNLCRIWEKDIVNCHEKRGAAFFHCVVLWNEEKARFDVATKDCLFPMILDNLLSEHIFIDSSDYEVVGNVIDHSDMLTDEHICRV